MKHAPYKLLTAVSAFAMLSGCISFGAKPPASLLTLTAAQTVPIGQTASTGTTPTITISVPSVPQMLATARIPVQTGPTSVAYVKDALWAEQPARLFARLMAETIQARTGRVVLSGAQAFADPGAKLAGELRNFGIDGATGDAVVTFEGTLMRGEARVFEKRKFEARVPAGEVTPASTAAALNAAANKVAAEVADWVGR